MCVVLRWLRMEDTQSSLQSLPHEAHDLYWPPSLCPSNAKHLHYFPFIALVTAQESDGEAVLFSEV